MCDNLGDHLVGNVYIKVLYTCSCMTLQIMLMHETTANKKQRITLLASTHVYTHSHIHTHSSRTRRVLRRQSSVSTTDGTMVSPSMQSCPRSPTSERLAAGSMRWGEYKTVNSRWCWISIMMYMSKANHTPKGRYTIAGLDRWTGPVDWNGGLAEIVPKLVPRLNSNSVCYLE